MVIGLRSASESLQAQTTLLSRFVEDSLDDKSLQQKAVQHLDMLGCCEFIVGLWFDMDLCHGNPTTCGVDLPTFDSSCCDSVLHNKSTTN